MSLQEAIHVLDDLRGLFTRIYEGRLAGEELVPIVTTAQHKIDIVQQFLRTSSEDEGVRDEPK